MSVNKVWILIYNNQEDRIGTPILISSPMRIQVSHQILSSYIYTLKLDCHILLFQSKTQESVS